MAISYPHPGAPSRSIANMQSKTTFALGVLAALMALLVVTGLYQNYSPIPFWDMWNGGLQFYLGHLQGDVAAWWRFHNEHQNGLAKVLFAVDFGLLGGRFYLLFLVNFLTAVATCYLFARCAKRVCAEIDWAGGATATAFLLSCWLLQWSQYGNFAWEFQGVFFLVQLLPCMAIYLLATRDDTAPGWVALAAPVVVGLLSWGTMANAVFTFPVLSLVAFRRSWGAVRMGVLICLSVAGAVLYGVGYSMSGEQIARSTADFSILGGLNYLFAYMGGPVKFLGADPLSARIVGAIILCLASWRVAKLLRAAKLSGVRLSLDAMLLYLLMSGGLAALGRARYGFEQAFASRYQTPVLMIWAALLLAYLPALRGWFVGVRWARKILALQAFTLAAAVFLLHKQVPASVEQQEMVHGREVAVLALEMSVRDTQAIGSIFAPEHYDLMHSLSEGAIRNGVGFAARPQAVARRASLGQHRSDVLVMPLCLNGSTQVKAFDGGVRIDGWLKADVPVRGVEYWPVVESETIVGHVISGKSSPQAKRDFGRAFRKSGLAGYHKGSTGHADLYIVNESARCKLKISESPQARARVDRASLSRDQS